MWVFLTSREQWAPLDISRKAPCQSPRSVRTLRAASIIHEVILLRGSSNPRSQLSGSMKRCSNLSFMHISWSICISKPELGLRLDLLVASTVIMHARYINTSVPPTCTHNLSAPPSLPKSPSRKKEFQATGENLRVCGGGSPQMRKTG